MSYQPLILVDGSSYFFRAFHALPPLTNSKGQPTGAVYGVSNMIKRLIKDYSPSHIAVIFDTPGKTFREVLYPEYKAHRPPMPDDLRVQYAPLIALLKAMGLPVLAIDGVEADDVIGTLATHAVLQGFQVLISTGDKDMAQLVNPKVHLINTMSQVTLDEQGVIEKFGVAATQIIDYLSLVGDPVDNVPGVSKCGPKTAQKWLNEYGSLDNLMSHAHEISGKIGESLRASLPHLDLTRTLVTIKTDVELPVGLEELHLKPEDASALIEVVQALEFKNWAKELLNSASPRMIEESKQETFRPTSQFELIQTEAAFKTWQQRLETARLICVDCETTSLNPLDAEIVGLSFAIEHQHPMYVPLAHQHLEPQLPREKILACLKPILENPEILKVGQNLKYDVQVLENYGIEVQGIAYDTMLESYILNSGANRHDLDTLALKYLNYATMTFESIAGPKNKSLRFDEIAIDKAAPYAAEDAAVTLKLHETLYPKFEARMAAVFHEIEMPLLKVLAHMERKGVLIDAAILACHGERLNARIKTLEEEAIGLAGQAFNLSSPKQLQEILYEKLGLPILAKTPTGQPSTAESVLQTLAYDYRLPEVILEYRSLSKLVSTYIEALPKRIHPKTGRVHTSYNQAVTATGRLSSSDPNLQNIPIRTEEGRLIRRAFIAPKGKILLACDYSQIELRIMAHLSADPNLLRAFQQGWDIHAATAAEIFGVELHAVTSEQRRRAKAVNFGLIYGMSGFGLSKQLGVSRQDAEHYIDTYFQRYPGVLNYMEQTREAAHQQGYVETLFGRRLYLPEINVRQMARRKAAERMAINAPMQGSAADIIKKSMIAIHDWQIQQTNPIAQLIMQVHDELVFEVEENAVDEALEKIKYFMEHTVELSVPLLVSSGVGLNWDEAH